MKAIIFFIVLACVSLSFEAHLASNFELKSVNDSKIKRNVSDMFNSFVDKLSEELLKLVKNFSEYVDKLASNLAANARRLMFQVAKVVADIFPSEELDYSLDKLGLKESWPELKQKTSIFVISKLQTILMQIIFSNEESVLESAKDKFSEMVENVTKDSENANKYVLATISKLNELLAGPDETTDEYTITEEDTAPEESLTPDSSF